MALACSIIRASSRAGLQTSPAMLRARFATPGPVAVAASKFKAKSDIAMDAEFLHAKAEKSTGLGPAVAARMALTAEVLVSKIFPAGFGWQTASLVADKFCGLGADTAGFALLTGVGDFTGVLLGHSLFYAAKKVAVDDSICMNSEVQTATWLASSAFLAGTAWQPTVNLLTGMGLGFNSVAVGTGAVTGLCFMYGLRLGRVFYGSFMPAIAPATTDNMVADAQLSVSIGGGTACFVGTDVSFGDANWLRPVVGVEETTPDLVGCVKAGSSTFLGFAAVQAHQNLFIPKGACWTD
eukprot:TRINITY_DN3054_c0_g1_i1.p1 TRINITY_DN3054_c0_g1~~TRINITY_DN3054_c0_g1_i1.p1  ORF type:complete len:295 (+),score=79.05 TRINITY_DN3054_c0_g1_i1:65-949(+)